MKKLIKHIITVFSSSVLLACATSNQGTDATESGASSRRTDCISEASIRDYQVLDASNLIVTGTARRKYHVALGYASNDLKHAPGLGFVGSAGWVCAGFGTVVVRQSMGFESGFGPERLRIRSIVLLSPEDEEFLLYRFGLTDPEPGQTRAPEPVEGAVVEELD